MNWHDLDPLVKILIATILCMMIGGGAGYIISKFDKFMDNREAQQKAEASQLVDCTGVDLVYDNKAEVKTLGHELRKMSYEGGKKDEV